MALALAALVCLASGFVLVCLGWSRRVPLASDLLLKASLSVGYGLGIFSVIFFLSRVFNVTNLIAVDLLVFACLLICFFLLRTHATTVNTLSLSKEERAGPTWFHRLLTAAFAIALCAALYSAIVRTLAHRHGDGWDAFAIWNLHARFLFRGGPHWRDGFSSLIPWSHPDYPLLLPAAVAHFWSYLGHDAPAVPAIIGLVFTFSTVGLLFSTLSILRGRMQAMLGGIALLATPSFIELGTWQYADVPLSFFFLATVALLCLHDDHVGDGFSQGSPGLLALAGLAASFAAWTKNEGVLFLCAIVLVRYLLIRRDSRRRVPDERAPSVREIAPLLGSILPIFVLIVYFKHFVAPPGDLFSDPKTMLHKLLDPVRYWAIVQWYAKEFLRFGHWLLVPATLLMLGYYFTVGQETRTSSSLALRSCVLALALTVAGYFAVYLVTPYDIYWHLRFSLSRLFLQLWPSSIFLFFLAVPRPSHG